MATNLPSCFSIQFLEQLLKFLVNFTLLKYVKSQRNYGFLITKELSFGFQILDLKDHFSASLNIRLDLLQVLLEKEITKIKTINYEEQKEITKIKTINYEEQLLKDVYAHYT